MTVQETPFATVLTPDLREHLAAVLPSPGAVSSDTLEEFCDALRRRGYVIVPIVGPLSPLLPAEPTEPAGALDVCPCWRKMPLSPGTRLAPSEPRADSEGLDAAWAEAEAALPEGWRVSEVGLAGIAPSQIKAGWQASAIGQWSRSDRSRPVVDGYGPTPVEALRALATALRREQPAAEGEL